MFTESKIKRSKKRTPSLQSNMEEVQWCFWGCCAASGTGCLECVHGIMKSGDYQSILERNVQPRVRKLGLGWRSWVLQQDNDPRHTSKSIQEWFKTKRWTVLKWPAISPDRRVIWKKCKSANIFGHGRIYCDAKMNWFDFGIKRSEVISGKNVIPKNSWRDFNQTWCKYV